MGETHGTDGFPCKLFTGPANQRRLFHALSGPRLALCAAPSLTASGSAVVRRIFTWPPGVSGQRHARGGRRCDDNGRDSQVFAVHHGCLAAPAAHT